MSMPVITVTPSSKTPPPEMSKSVREASFSSYLDGAEATFVLKLGATRPRDHILLPKDREIDVFDAQKYFNEGLNRSPKDSSSPHHKKDAPPIPVQVLAMKEHSIHSESSCNSRSALLHTISRNHKPKKKSFLATIACNCPCANNHSTNIKTNTTATASPKTRKADNKTNNDQLVRKSHSQGHFTFPVFNSKKDNEEEAAKRKVVMEKKKKISMMSWDAIAPPLVSQELRIPSISSEMHNESESDSDSSSDLFEIESLSKGNPFLSRQASEGYAPSEASIEWSVITASAADFSLLSDSEEFTVPCPKKSGRFKEIPKVRPSILSGCKNHRAVSVAADAHRPIEQEISNARLMTRFHHESKLAAFDAKRRQQSFDARIQRPPNSAHLLYT